MPLSKKEHKDLYDEHTTGARRVLDVLWNEADACGRTWGRKKRDRRNPFFGTNILFAVADELVSVSWRRSRHGGKLVVHQFARVKTTVLGRKVKKTLRAAGLPVQK